MNAEKFIEENYFGLKIDCPRDIQTIYQALEDYAKEQLRLYNVSNSCGIGDTSILIKGLEDISNWDDEQEEWYDDPGHCANMTLIKYYNSKK